MTDARGARIVRLINDPSIGGDLLLLGMALAAKYDLGLKNVNGFNELSRLLWPENRQSTWHVRAVLRRDIRTYKPSFGHKCTAPMVRRTGPCEKSATLRGLTTDWATGEQTYVGGCGRHHDWAQKLLRDNWTRKPEVVPLPVANAGGALRVHFPRIDWPGLWRKLDPRWVEHPETQEWPKPDLKLVLGADEGSAPAAPILSIVRLGGAS